SSVLITEMLTRRSMVVSAAAWLSNLPLIVAIGVVGPHISDDGFPPLLATDLIVEGNAVSCHYSNEKTMEEIPKSLRVRLERASAVRTEAVICPSIEAHRAFRSTFSFGQNVLSKFEFGFPHFDYAKALWRYTFKAPPPEGTGLDPLRNISETSFTQQLESVSLATRRLDKPRDGGERITQDALFGIGNGIAALGEMRKACADAMAIVKTEYPTFTGLCKEYLNMSNAAIKAAGSSEEWTFRGKENARLVYPIFHPDIVVKEGSAYRSILRPFGFGFLDKYGLWELPK
ncbi:hypothetical protein FOZ63_013906, partial [Perkinsus olseni]